MAAGLFDVAQVAGNAFARSNAEDRRKQLFQQQSQAADLLNQSFMQAGSNPDAARQLYIQAYQLAPDFVSNAVTGLQSQQKAMGGRDERGASEREFENLISGFSDEEKENARRIKAGLSPRAVGSSDLTIAESGKTGVVADAKSRIAAAVQSAKDSAKSVGQTIDDLSAAKAALPDLENVVTQLKALAPVATSTYSGRAFDAVSKELGFGATDGATARAKFVAIVDNQILPLLKQTFGAAFTEAEGERLKATMGDPDASPNEKLAQLDVFIESKRRAIEQSRRLLEMQAGDNDKKKDETVIDWESM